MDTGGDNIRNPASPEIIKVSDSLDIVLEKTETPQNKEVSINEENDTTYFTIQVAARSTFPEAMIVIKELNKLDFDAFIQTNDRKWDSTWEG